MALPLPESSTTAGAMTPAFRPIRRRIRETHDVVTLELDAPSTAPFKPGQFNMLYAFGIGEVPISMSSDAAAGDRIAHTVRAVGPVSTALTKLKRNDTIGVRGPFGSAWPVDIAAGSDVLVIAGGIGMAPLRPVLYHVMNTRDDFGKVGLLYGARHPDELLFQRELDSWRRTPGLQVRVTVDHAGRDWIGDVGVVTTVLPKLQFDPLDTVAMICGPEPMIRFVAQALQDRGVTPDRIFISMERNMKCAIGHCGHCQYGPEFVCKDGPVFPLDRVAAHLAIREL